MSRARWPLRSPVRSGPAPGRRDARRPRPPARSATPRCATPTASTGSGSGGGATVAILGVSERPSAKDIADNAACFGYRPLRSRTLLTDGQLWPIFPGFFEPQEDLALVRGMAPAASIIFTQAPAAAEQWFLGASQVLDHPPLPDTLSISYGICETDVLGNGPDASPATRAGSALLNALLVRLGTGRRRRLRVRRRRRLELRRRSIREQAPDARDDLAWLIPVPDVGRGYPADAHSVQRPTRRGRLERPALEER